jgi:hypothetical protein
VNLRLAATRVAAEHSGRTGMKISAILVLVATLAVAVITGALHNFISVPYETDITGQGTKLVGALFVVTVFVERSTAVIASIWFDQAIKIAEVKENFAYTEFTRKGKLKEDLDRFQNATISRIETEAQRNRLKSYLALIMALFVSSVGVRTLENLQVLPGVCSTTSLSANCLSTTQLGLYRSVDILITTGLIAGGSAGIAALADLLKKGIEKTAQRIIASWPGPKFEIVASSDD